MVQFTCQTKIYSGTGATAVLRQYAAKRVFVVTDPYFSKNGIAEELGKYLPQSEICVYDGVKPDPSVAIVAEGTAICQKFRPDMLIALGGGSAMDCAKGIRYAIEFSMMFLAIPTSSGSGSEMTSYAVLSHNENKHPLVDQKLRPDVAILDDNYLKELPKTLIAHAGMDVLAHSLEALAGLHRSNFTDALALHAAQMVIEKLVPSFEGDRLVRLQMHEAASMAGLAFEQAGLGLCHAAAHVVGGEFHIPHGVLCGIFLPVVLQINGRESMRGYGRLARQCGLPAATDRLALRSLVDEIEKLRRKLRMPENLKQAGVEHAAWQSGRDHILNHVLKDPCCNTNPIPVTKEVVAHLFRAVEG